MVGDKYRKSFYFNNRNELGASWKNCSTTGNYRFFFTETIVLPSGTKVPLEKILIHTILLNMVNPSILITFVGSHDPCNPDGSEGPILSFVNTKSFQKIYLFYNNVEFLRRAREIEEAIHKKSGKTGIEYIAIDVESPIDYEALFREMSTKLLTIEKNNKNKDPRYYILTDSGTPQMQTCWVLIVFSGLFDAELIQGIPAQFAGGTYRAKPIRLKTKDFPVILKPPMQELLFEQSFIPPITRSSDEEIPGIWWKNLIGTENNFLRVKNEAVRVAKYDINVLIYGETGSGKELFARLIHHSSARKNKPFVAVNCSAISAQIAESELFGHKKGAFTGAISDREGYFSVADKGTIFLDEVGDLPAKLQPKLMRVLESGNYMPVGADRERNTDVRIIAATNKNLEGLCDTGSFRLDLLTRLKEYTLSLPPLRDRKNDIPLLTKYFLDEWNTRYSEQKILSADTVSYLTTYPWPGNVRELRNAVLSMCAVSSPDEEIQPRHLPHTIKHYFTKKGTLPVQVSIPYEGLDLKSLLFTLEKRYYKAALEITGGNRAEAARLLGIAPAAFRKAFRERFSD